MLGSPLLTELDSGCVRWCVGLLCCAFGIIPSIAAAEPNTAVRARVVWIGPCEDQPRLANELSERGIAWLSTSSDDTESAPLELSVETSQRSQTHVVAHLQLSDAAGSHETRLVEVARCDLLHPALALILSSFAERLNTSEVPPVSAPAAPAMSSSPSTPKGVQPRPDPTHHHAPPKSSPSLRLRRLELRTKQTPNDEFGELRFGTHSIAGLGWGGALAIGAVLQLEWRPLKRWPFWLAAGYAHLPTLSHSESDAEVDWLRRFGRVGATVQSPLPHLKLSVSAEWGSTQASAFSPAGGQTAQASWYALTAMPRVDIRLIGHTLILHAASGLAFTPVRYTLKYADTERALVRSAQLEWRAELGLSVQLSASIP